jgi:23S rRNA (uracil1939-C5)-methyltransferase
MRKNTKNEVLLTLIVNAASLGEKTEKAICDALTEKHGEIRGILLNTNKKEGNSLLGDAWRTLWGEEYLYDTLCNRQFRIAPAAFYQVNHDQTEKLYYIAKEFADIKADDTVFDLYCGTGTIGIILAEKGVNLVGVEISKDAVRDASENAKRNGIDAEFICLDTGEALNSERLKDKNPDVIIIDPPRKGCGDDAVEKIASFNAKRIVYISCNPQTLARDLVKFESCGYKAEKAIGVDLFPRTGHCECVAKLTRHI